MKVTKLVCIFLGFLTVYDLYAQNVESSNTEETTKVEKVAKKVDNTNAAVSNTAETTEETITNLKETFGTFFGKKGKASSSEVQIIINDTDYDNPDLDALYKALASVKGVKDPAKQYSNRNMAMKFTYKSGVSNLWDAVPNEVRAPFTLMEAADNMILIQYDQGESANK